MRNKIGEDKRENNYFKNKKRIDSYKKFVKSTSPAVTAPTITIATIPKSFFPLIGSVSVFILL